MRAVNVLEKIGNDFNIDELKNFDICKIVTFLTGVESNGKISKYMNN